ncbi:hypothetical protein BGZ94_007939 [Podila epigama]|nr:hypothetical protein BGZ94_007939 [Podila epigama]
MTTRYSIDFVVRMLNASIFHVSFPFLLIPLVKWYGYSNDSAPFQAAIVFGAVLYLWKTILWFHDRQQRTSGKIDWDDEVVLITGGASGIGYLLAEMLAIRHITVVVVDVQPVKTALDVDSYICDISNPADVARVAKEIREDVGEPTILVNNAAIVHGKPVLDLSFEEIKRTLDVNFLGQALMVKEFLPDMIKNNHGHIITISSAMGIMAAPKIADYAASKAAAKAFHEGLESEIKYLYKTPGVKTTLFHCAKIATDMFGGVRVRFPFWTPTLEPIQVVREIIESMEQRRGRNQVMMPFFVHFVPLVSILPNWIGDLATRLCGADEAMETFVGKSGKERESLKVVDAAAEAITLDEPKKDM